MIKCEWKGCSHKAEYLVQWNNSSRPLVVEPFADHNFLCENHLRELKGMFLNLKPLEIYELTEPFIKVQFT